MKKIIITGAGGFFSSRFCEFYKDKYDIIPFKRTDLDISRENETLRVIKDVKPDYVIHAAAIADTGNCEKDPNASYSTNVLGTVNVAKGCAAANAKLVFLSTEQIFNGNIEEGPYAEDHIPNPNTVYGKHKLEAEKRIGDILEENLILRFTWLFGFPERAGKVNPNIVWNVLNAALKGKRISVPTNEFRGMTYIYDLLKNFENILELPSGIYHTGSENNLSTYETCEIVLKEMGLYDRVHEIIAKDEDKYRESPRDIRISNSRLKKEHIYFLQTEEAVKKCIEDFNYRLK